MVMKKEQLSVLLSAVFLFAAASVAVGEVPQRSLGGEIIYGGSLEQAKAGGDTINLMAARGDPTNDPGEPSWFGDFEDEFGTPAWNGWTHRDLTQPAAVHWNVSNYNQTDPLNHAAWCGDINFDSCEDIDPVGGYGNYWDDTLEFRLTVPYPELAATVTVAAILQTDSDPGNDFTHLSYRFEGHSLEDMQTWDGTGTVTVMESVTYLPGEYLGQMDIAVYFRFTSNSRGSDEDCRFPSTGGCQVDDIDVHVVNGAYEEHFFEDFEPGGVPDDFGHWNVAFPGVVGDFAKLWSGLSDADPCRTNLTPQVAFIDDGVVVPGTGGTDCINWCYGPGGYIVTTTGGLAGPAEHLHSAIESPVMDWPPNNPGGPELEGMVLSFDAYRHEDLTPDAPGVFYTWGVRSADTDGSAFGVPQIISEQGWQDRNFVYYGIPEYFRHFEEVSDLINDGRDEIQVQLAVYELGWIWGWDGDDGYPAPYFDNVTVKIFPITETPMVAREIDLAQDNFPEQGIMDFGNLGSNHVRFDMARNISQSSHLLNDPGDSIIVSIATLPFDTSDWPKLNYILQTNPLFDPYRTGFPSSGSVDGRIDYIWELPMTFHRYSFDLPDTGFIFPGDVLHYFISTTDTIGSGGGAVYKTTLMPPDTTGFSTGFNDPLGYDPTFTFHALPSIRDDGQGGYVQPGTLFINDFGSRDGENKWYMALNNIGLVMGEGYDVYHVNGPSSGAGNGIGGRASPQLLVGYDNILYASGDLFSYTISNGDFSKDEGDDVGVLTGWLDLGGKNMFLTGDGLASDLTNSGAATLDFLQNYMGVANLTNNVGPLIGSQTTPLVQVDAGNPIFTGALTNWIAYGGCEGINTFDGVEAIGPGQRIAEFLDPAGNAGSYTYAAATLNILNPGPAQSKVISMPFDLMFVYTDPAVPGNVLPGRVRLLKEVLQYFGVVGDPGDVTNVPDRIKFSATNHPNPFNPRTTIKYSLPKSGHMKLSIYNVRGHLVKTLINGPRPAGADQTFVWDGSDNLGSAAASGVYFFEARAGGEVKIGKMTLVK